MFGRVLFPCCVAFLSFSLAVPAGRGREKQPELPPEVQLSEDSKVLLERLENGRNAEPVKVEAPDLSGRLEVRHYLLTDAYAATGYRVTALRKELAADQLAGRDYVTLETWDGVAERAEVYDSMGSLANIVEYLWNGDREVYGAVLKTYMDRMLRIYGYCPNAHGVEVHELSNFRVSSPFIRRVEEGKERLDVTLVKGLQMNGRPLFEPRLEELCKREISAEPYEAPDGLHRHSFLYDSMGNLLDSTRHDHADKLVDDLYGIARITTQYKSGQPSRVQFFGETGIRAGYDYRYDSNGQVVSKRRIDATGGPAVDFLGVSTYLYQRDQEGRIELETRKTSEGEVTSVQAFEYGPLDQVTKHETRDAEGKVQTTLQYRYTKKGLLTELSLFEGKATAGRLKKDPAGVAVYRFQYNKGGRRTMESYHGPISVVGSDGKKDLMLVNGPEGFALREVTYDGDGYKPTKTRVVRVDESGQVVEEEVLGDEQTHGILKGKAVAGVRGALGALVKAVAQTRLVRSGAAGAVKQEGGKRGQIRLEYFPRSARVTVVQRSLIAEGGKEPYEWKQPAILDNDSLHLNDGEELPYLKLEGLPIEVKGRGCPGSDGYLAPGEGACGAAEQLDGTDVTFSYRYELLFEADSYLPQAVSYGPEDWINLGSGKYTVGFPKDFALLRDWSKSLPPYESVRRQTRCWRLEWEDAFDAIKYRHLAKSVTAGVESGEGTASQPLAGERGAAETMPHGSPQEEAPIPDNPESFLYTLRLALLKEMPARQEETAPYLLAVLRQDFGLYLQELERVERFWATKAKVLRKYRRGRRFVESLEREPRNTRLALRKKLALLDIAQLPQKNAEDRAEAAVATMAAEVMGSLNDQFNEWQGESFVNHVRGLEEILTGQAGFSQLEWRYLEKEVRTTLPDWHKALSTQLENRRLDCRQLDYPKAEGFEAYLEGLPLEVKGN